MILMKKPIKKSLTFFYFKLANIRLILIIINQNLYYKYQSYCDILNIILS